MINGGIGGSTYSGNGFGNAAGVATEEEQNASANQNFWDQVYSQFNPQAPVSQTPSSAPAYGTAAANTQNYLKQAQETAGGQGTGKADIGGVNQAIQNTAGQMSRTQDLNSYLSDAQKNTQTSNQYQEGAQGRMQNLFGTQEKLNQLPQNRELTQAQTQDQINKMWQEYLNGQNPSANLIGGAAGGLIGKLAGGAHFGGGQGGNQTQNPFDIPGLEDYYNQQEGENNDGLSLNGSPQPEFSLQ